MKLRNKLILSCAALAAVATTAVSTTYAWYTSNQEVTADSIYAETSSNSDALLLISKTGAANSWSSKVSLDIDADFVPMYRDDNGNMHVWASDENATDSSNATSGFISFSLYFKSGNGNALKISYKNFDLLNITDGNLPVKSVLSNNGLPTGATSNGEYSVNILKAITMENTFGLAVEGEANTTAQAFTNGTTGTAAYQFAGGYVTAKSDTVGSNTVNAHQYYNDVKSLDYKRANTYDANATYYTKANDTFTAATGYVANTQYYTYTNGQYTLVAIADATAYTTAGGNDALFTRTEGQYTQATVADQAALDAGIYYVVAAIETQYDGSVEYRTTGSSTRTAISQTSNLNNAAQNITAINTNAFGIIENAEKILRVDYVIYLDGWDYACFDACQSQRISLSMEFQSQAA